MFKKLRRIYLEKTTENPLLDRKKESAFFPELEANKEFTRMYLVIGPESTATRLLTRLLSQHPDVVGTLDASEHVDLLDNVWKCIEDGHYNEAKNLLPDIKKGNVFVTRRSMPHSTSVKKSAEYLNFPNLHSFYKFCTDNKITLHLFVTSRSPVPTFVSSVLNRGSVSRSLRKAKLQYMASYMHIFEAIIELGLPFSIVSLESLLNDKEYLINSLFELMELDRAEIDLDLQGDINFSKYEWYSSNKDV